MRADRQPGRVASAATLLLHLVVVGLLPFADARLELAAMGERVHIESDRQGSCLPGHDHLVCQLCRVISAPASAGAARAAAPPPPTVAGSAPSNDVGACGRHDVLQPSPRAPPLA